MIKLATLATRYQGELERRYGHLMRFVHHRALQQIRACHTVDAGAMVYHCEPCQSDTTFYPSCGHRHCPACQHQCNNDWLDGQRQKQLPADYYLITFTLPAQLRTFVWYHQKWAYQALFEAAKETLNSFFKQEPKLKGKAGFIGVLHTHSRPLDFHPHVHFVVPNGSVDGNNLLWRTKAGDYLFKAKNLAKVFQGKFISKMVAAGYYLPAKTPKVWNASCKYVGKGDSALTYLARYLYRGVINENNILSLNHDQVTFQYKDSTTKQFKTIKEHAADFLWRVLQHVLPKGFRRARDYGLLHGNAKAKLKQLQLMLRVHLPPLITRKPKVVCCPQCHAEMELYLMRIGQRKVLQLR